MSKMPRLTQAELHAMLDYRPETGEFIWRTRNDVRPQWNGRYAGKLAGYAREATGGGWYWSVRIHDWPFHAGPLAWFYVTGSWPSHLIDHKDGDGLNNRWANLRPATQSQNGANRGPSKNNRSGFKGVSMDDGRYRATFRGKFLGYRDTAKEAAALYAEAASAYFGEYARVA